MTFYECSTRQICDPSLAICTTDKSLLGRRTRCEHALGLPISVDAGTPNDSANRISITQGVAEWFYKNSIGSFASAVTVSAGVKCPTDTGSREHTLFVHRESHCRREDQIDTTHKSTATLSPSDGFTSQIDADQ